MSEVNVEISPETQAGDDQNGGASDGPAVAEVVAAAGAAVALAETQAAKAEIDAAITISEMRDLCNQAKFLAESAENSSRDLREQLQTQGQQIAAMAAAQAELVTLLQQSTPPRPLPAENSPPVNPENAAENPENVAPDGPQNPPEPEAPILQQVTQPVARRGRLV